MGACCTLSVAPEELVQNSSCAVHLYLCSLCCVHKAKLISMGVPLFVFDPMQFPLYC